jgi:phage terminase large subunit GpA-like protein
VQVYGILPGQPFDIVIVDRYDVRYSKRRNEEGEREWLKPHVYSDDWHELIEHVIEKEYEVDDGSGRLMGIKQVGCDSGGREGVTGKAYEFYRHLRKLNKHGRFILLKGEGLPNQPRTRISTPDSSRKDQKAVARGDIPVMIMNSNLLKDDLNGRLDSIIPGKGMIRFPDWLSISFYNEMCAETRTEKGWENLAQVRNEAWDLTYYCIALCISQMLRLEHIDWSNPPSWAADWEKNDFVRLPEKESIFEQQKKSSYDFASFGKALA